VASDPASSPQPPTEPHWIDLCDPDEASLQAALPPDIHETALTRIRSQAREEPQPRLTSQGNYVFGVLAFPAQNARGDLVFQEVDVIANLNVLVTIRKTPVGHTACEFDDARNAALRNGSPPGLCLRVVDDEIAERFLTMVDGFDDIDELEDHVTDWPAPQLRGRISSIRHDILHVRRDRRARPLARPARRGPRLPPGGDREQPERGHEAPDRRRVRGPRPDVHRRSVRPELQAHPRARVGRRVSVVVGSHRRHDRLPALVLPAQTLDLSLGTDPAARRPGVVIWPRDGARRVRPAVKKRYGS
jgi:CorA-like Mg2+ transporter protein